MQQWKAEFDLHEAIFGPGTRALDIDAMLGGPDLDLQTIDKEEQTLTPDSKTDASSDGNNRTVPPAPKKRKWLSTHQDSITDSSGAATPVKLMRHVDYTFKTPQAGADGTGFTPRRRPLIQFDETSPSPKTGGTHAARLYASSSSPASSRSSELLKAPNTSSGLMRHYDLGPFKTSSNSITHEHSATLRYDHGSSMIGSHLQFDGRPLVQLSTNYSASSTIANDPQAAPIGTGEHEKGESMAARLIKRSRNLRL